jgi:hypothetical protein
MVLAGIEAAADVEAGARTLSRELLGAIEDLAAERPLVGELALQKPSGEGVVLRAVDPPRGRRITRAEFPLSNEVWTLTHPICHDPAHTKAPCDGPNGTTGGPMEIMG